MTPQAFRAALEALGLSVEDFGALVGLNPITCRYWGRARSGRGMQAFPAWVPLLLDAWRKHPKLMPR